ncbi:Nuclear pore complex protein Nup214 [Camponotus japonicus]
MKTAPDPIYVQEFLFKQSNTSQVFDLKTPTYIPAACNLLVADKKRGLLYIGHDDKITVLKPAEENNAEWKIELQLPSVVSKIAINCDYNYIAVAVALKPTILIYDAHSLARNCLNLLLEITSSNKLDSYVTDIRWNPTVPTMLCTITSDCIIGSFQLRIDENSVPKISILSKISNEPQALCAAWSPKGKQVAVGCKNGDIVQLKPDTLKIARTIAGPSPSIGEVISILWISNYQFCAAYLNSERHTNVLIIDAPKGEINATFTCFEDITYGFPDAEGEGSILRYYFEHVPEWGLIIAGSSTSSEIAVLGTTDGGANWNQWQLVDSGRAQLPLMRTTEIYPLGLAVDKSPINKLPWGTDSTLPHPVPILHILGTSGQLCSFHMVNLTPNCPAINIHPTEIITAPTLSQPTSSTEISFTINAAVTSTPRPKQPEIASERLKSAPMTNIFGDSLKAAGFFQQPVEQPVIQPKSQEEKIAPSLAPTKPVVPKEIPALEPTKTETKLVAADKEASSPQVMEQKASIDDSIRMRAYLQEQALFEKELRNRLEPQVWECGTDEERKRLGETSAVIEQFLRDLRDTTNSLSSDIAYSKALLLQSFAWLEETKSKNAAAADITGRNCSDNSKIADLQRCYYYTQTQLNQVSKILDLEWSEHKAQERSKMKIPSSEYIYQNLLVHNKIIAKEKEKLEQISRQWKSLNRSLLYTTGNIPGNLNRSMANLHLNSHEKSSSIRKADVIEARCKTIASRTLSFTHEKQIKLKALLTESSPRIIKPVNPSPIQDRLKATLSSLASLSPAVTETKTKTESSIVKQNTVVKQQTAIDQKQMKAQSPLASLNSIVARIGSSDMNNSIVAQNKIQQKPLPTTVSFPPAMSVKQMDKKTIPPAVSIVSQSKPKQDLNVNFPSSINLTFGTSTLKSQDIIFPKSSLTDTTAKSNKESTINDSIPKGPESALSSTGPLKDVLSTEYPLTETARTGIARNLPSLSVAPAVKTDAASTFSFATPSNAVSSVTKNSSSGIALDTMSFVYSKSTSNTTVEPSITAVQTPIDLSTLSLTLQPTNHSNNNVNGKVNTNATPMSFAALAPALTQVPTMTAAVSPVTTIGGLTISLVDPNITQRKSMEMPPINPATIEKITTSEATFNFGSIATQVPPTSLSVTPIFGGQVIKNTLPEVTTTTLPATTTFGVVAFPSITSTFGSSTPASTTSVFSGLTSNTSAGTTVTSSSVTSVSSSTPSPFQSSLSKPMFGEITTTSIPATNYGISSSNVSAGTISFGISTIMTTTTTTTAGITASAASITPAFSKSGPIASPVSNAQFPSVQISASSAVNVFTKPIINPASPFGNTGNSVFSNVSTPSSSNTSIFGGNSMNSIFGSAPLSSPSESIFGGNATGFGASAPSESIFNTTPKSDIMFGGTANTSSATSPFGSAMSNASPMIGSSAGTNVFSSTMPNASPIQQPMLGGNQPAFGQTSTFGTKPVFGSSPIFGSSKPASGFGTAPVFESPGIGFGSPSIMQGGSTMENMPKLFGEVAGSSTFESLANQSGGLSFDSLAQKNPEPEKPTFTAGSSFSSWR